MDKSIMSEQSVIGCILIDPAKVMPEVAEQLTAADFYSPMGKMVIDATLKLYGLNKAIDVVSVLHETGNNADAKIFLASCIKATPSAGPHKDYIAMVKECSRRRRATEKAIELFTALGEGEELGHCQTIATEASEALNDTKFGESFNAAQGLVNFFTTKSQPKTYIKTGFSVLDNFIFVGRGDYVIIGGRPSAGKTALALQMLENMAQSHKVVFFSLETSKEKIFDRLIALYTDTSMEEIKRQHIANWDKIAQSSDDFIKLNFEVVEAAGWTVAQISAKAVQLGAEVIFIDYISLIYDKTSKLYERVSNISIGLHTMAQQRKICVIALSQLSRAGNGSSPDMTSLRESGQLEQDADVVLLVSGDENEDESEPIKPRKVKIAKNKEGQTGVIKFNFDGLHQRFYGISRDS